MKLLLLTKCCHLDLYLKTLGGRWCLSPLYKMKLLLYLSLKQTEPNHFLQEEQ